MRLRRLSAALALLAVIAAGPVRAQAPAPSPESMQAARELFTLLSQDLLGQLTTQMTSVTWPGIERELASRLDRAAIADLRRDFERIQLEHVTDLIKDAPAIYAKRFTAQELRELMAFYRGPTGQKMMRELPNIMAETMQLILPRMPDIQAQTANAFQRVLRERGHAK